MSGITSKTAYQVFGSSGGALPAAGYIGERFFTTAARNSVALTSATSKNVVTLTPSAGLWLLSAAVEFTPNTTTSVTRYDWSISKTTNTLPASGTIGAPSAGEFWQFWQQVATIPTNDNGFSIPMYLYGCTDSVTPIYVVAQSTFSASTMGCGGFLSAIRIG